MYIMRRYLRLTSAWRSKCFLSPETTNDFILRDINSAANNVFENETVAIDAMTKPYNTTLSYEYFKSYIGYEKQNKRYK